MSIMTAPRPLTPLMDLPTRPRRLADLPSISLDVLAGQAGRMTRVDRKYVVPKATLDVLLEACAPDAVALEIDGARAFRYASTYLDTPQLRAFHEGGRKRRLRFKVRTRSYLDTGGHYLEVKTGGARGTTIKTRIGVDAPLTSSLTTDQVDFVHTTLADRGIRDVTVSSLRPALDVRYTRSTLAFLSAGDRTTLDTDLTWVGPDGRKISRPDLAVVETKAGSTATSVDRLLWRLGHRPLRMSKYGIGLALLRPSLPHLKWHHTLTHPLLAARSLAVAG